MTRWTYAATKDGYSALWNSAAIKSSDQAKADRFAKLIISGEGRYRSVQDKTGVPWFFIGALHMRESSCSFAGVLHNGEHIIGTGRKTKLVPAGRGPFGSWEAAAIDALKLKNLDGIKDWNIARMAFEAERFNGLGYANRGINSPYLWAGSNHEQSGKYVADGVFDSDADDTQLGVMTVLLRLQELRPDIRAAIIQKPVSAPPDVEPPAPPNPDKPLSKSKTIWGGIIGFLSGVATFIGAIFDHLDNPYALAAFGLFFATGIIGLILVVKGRIDVQKVVRRLIGE